MAASPIRVSIDARYRRKVTQTQVRTWATAALAALGQPPDAELDIAITGDAEVQELNRTYRGLDAPTDVLSFPYTDAATPAEFYGDAGDAPTADDGDPFVLPPEAGTVLGELVLSYPYAERQATAAGHPVAEELALLTVHGVLHLLGYDHLEPGDQAAMWAQTNAILAGLRVNIRL